MLAITSGATVTIWDHHRSVDDDFHPYSYQPIPDETAGITNFSWNHDGSKIATCSSSTSVDRPNIAITTVNDENNNARDPLAFHSSCSKFSDTPLTLSTRRAEISSQASSISYGGKSRYLCVSAGNDISVFDLKKSERVRQYRIPKNSNSLPGDCGKSCVIGTLVAATSNNNGALFLYQLKETAQAPTKLSLFDKTLQLGCNALCYPTKSTNSNHVCQGMNNGNLLVWDILQGTLACAIDTSIIAENGQSSSIHDLLFSPQNSHLLASCSNDNLFFHDASSAKSVATLSVPDCGDAFTSLSLSNDGVKCAVGTAAGKALLYDLRRSDSPFTMNIGTKPVTCVRFQQRTRLSSAAIISKESRTDSKTIEFDSNRQAKNEGTEYQAQTIKCDSNSDTIQEPDRLKFDSPKNNDVGTKTETFSGHSCQANDARVVPNDGLESPTPRVKNNNFLLDLASNGRVSNRIGQEKNTCSLGKFSDYDVALQKKQSTVKYLQRKQQQHHTSDRLDAVQKELRSLRHEIDGNIKSLREEVRNLFKDQSNQLSLLMQQHTGVVEKLIEENKELKAEVERLRRF